jgi:hypothetical protein
LRCRRVLQAVNGPQDDMMDSFEEIPRFAKTALRLRLGQTSGWGNRLLTIISDDRKPRLISPIENHSARNISAGSTSSACITAGKVAISATHRIAANGNSVCSHAPAFT